MLVRLVAVVAMLVQQSLATTIKVGLPALFPAIAGELAFDPKYVQVCTWFFAAVAVIVMAGCGGVIRHFGALRTSQIGCVSTAAGLAAVALLAWHLCRPCAGRPNAIRKAYLYVYVD